MATTLEFCVPATMVTSPVVLSACTSTAVALFAGIAAGVFTAMNLSPSSEREGPSEVTPTIIPVSQSAFRSLYVPVVVLVAACVREEVLTPLNT